MPTPIADRLKRARIDAGFTLKEVYLKTGIPPSTLSRTERGLKLLNRIDQAVLLARTYNVDIAWLLGHSEFIKPLTEREQQLITVYRRLPHNLKEWLCYSLDMLVGAVQ